MSAWVGNVCTFLRHHLGVLNMACGRRRAVLRGFYAFVIIVLLAFGKPYNVNASPRSNMSSSLATDGVPDSFFDQLFTQYGPGWTGGDSTYSVPLPDGRTLWMFSDSFIGTVNPVSGLRSSWIVNVRNALVTTGKNGSSFTTLYDNGANVNHPASYFLPSNSKDWFWVGDGIVLPQSSGEYVVVMFLLEWTTTSTNPLQFVGNTLVELSPPNMTVLAYQNLNLPPTIEWGSSLLLDGKTVYVYGIEDLGAKGKFAHVARTIIGQLSNPSTWTFWNGSAWVPGLANSARILGNISNEYSVSKINNTYVMTAMDTSSPYGTWKNIVTYTATSPWGPWVNRTVVYQTPETGQDSLITYDPRAHPEFTQDNQLLISYNVNSLNARELVNASIYRPRFIIVPLTVIMHEPSPTTSSDSTGGGGSTLSASTTICNTSRKNFSHL